VTAAQATVLIRIFPMDAKGILSMVNRRFISLLVLAAASLVFPVEVFAQATQLSGSGSVEYHLVHKFHKMIAVSKAMAVRGSVDASGLKVMARAQVSTFDSDNANRDSHMMETVEGEKYPYAIVRGVVPGFKLPTSGTTKVTMQAAVELHGVAVNHPVTITLETKDGTHFHVTFEFSESLTAHKIERPSLLFVAVDDLITIVGKADVTAKP
jgi:phage tail sheath gpL-like